MRVCNWDMDRTSDKWAGPGCGRYRDTIRAPYIFHPLCMRGHKKIIHVQHFLAVMPARCYAPPPPPTFGRNCCIGLFYLHYMPPTGARAGLRYCTCTRVASVEELHSCIKRVENSLRTGLGLFH